jgi:hypothetical protein
MGRGSSRWFRVGSSKVPARSTDPARSFHHRRRRRSDISAHLASDAALAQDVSGQRRRRGLSVGAGDADVRPWRNGAASSSSPITGMPRARTGFENPDPPERRAKSPPARRRETPLRFAVQNGTPISPGVRLFIHGAHLGALGAASSPRLFRSAPCRPPPLLFPPDPYHFAQITAASASSARTAPSPIQRSRTA